MDIKAFHAKHGNKENEINQAKGFIQHLKDFRQECRDHLAGMDDKHGPEGKNMRANINKLTRQIESWEAKNKKLINRLNGRPVLSRDPQPQEQASCSGDSD